MTKSSSPERPGSLRAYRVQKEAKEAGAKSPKIRNAAERVKARQEKFYREEADASKKSLIMSKDQKLLRLLKENPENENVELLRAGDLNLLTEISESAEYKNLSEPNKSNICALTGDLTGIYLVKNKLNQGGSESAKLYVNFKGSFRALLIEPSANGDEKKIFVLDKDENGKAAKIDLAIKFKGELGEEGLKNIAQKTGDQNKKYADTVANELNDTYSETKPDDRSEDREKTEQKFLERVTALQDVVKGAFVNLKTAIADRIKAFDPSIKQTVPKHKQLLSVFETEAENSDITLSKALEQLRRSEENKPLSRESDAALPFIRSLIQTGTALSAFKDNTTANLYRDLLSNITNKRINVEELREKKEELIAAIIPASGLDAGIKDFLTKDLQKSFDISAIDLYRGRIGSLLERKNYETLPVDFPSDSYVRSLNILLNALSNDQTSATTLMECNQSFKKQNKEFAQSGIQEIEKWRKVAIAVENVYNAGNRVIPKTENLRALFLTLENALKSPEKPKTANAVGIKRQASVAEAELPEITSTKNNASPK